VYAFTGHLIGRLCATRPLGLVIAKNIFFGLPKNRAGAASCKRCAACPTSYHGSLRSSMIGAISFCATLTPWKSGNCAGAAVSKSAGFSQLLNSPENNFFGVLDRRRKPLSHRRLPPLEVASEPSAARGATKEFLKIRIAHRSNRYMGRCYPLITDPPFAPSSSPPSGPAKQVPDCPGPADRTQQIRTLNYRT